MGYDADHPMARGEVGKEGVAVSTLKDFEVLYSGIPLDRVTTSMTIKRDRPLRVVLLRGRGRGSRASRRTSWAGPSRTTSSKEYIAQKEWVVGPRPATRIVGWT